MFRGAYLNYNYSNHGAIKEQGIAEFDFHPKLGPSPDCLLMTSLQSMELLAAGEPNLILISNRILPPEQKFSHFRPLKKLQPSFNLLLKIENIK